MATIVDDRLLARVARDAVAWNDAADPASLADVALGQAVVALRVLGVAPTPEVTRAVGQDIADIIADPEQLARARDFARRVADGLPPARLAA